MCGTVISEYMVHARKRHRCCACRQPIQPGDYYIKSCWKDGGDFGAEKWHQECRAEFCDMLSRDGDDCGDPWDTWEREPDWLKARYRWQLTDETVELIRVVEAV